MTARLKLINDSTGEEIPMWSTTPDKEGRICLVEALVNRPDVGPMVLISHEAAGAHLTFPANLGARIEETDR